jgi:hypothetical protein
MNWLKLITLMIAFALAEILVGFFLFLFATFFKDVYVLFSLGLIVGLILFLIISRIKEKRKIFTTPYIAKKYTKNVLFFLLAILSFCIICLSATIVYMLFFLH